MVSPLQAAVAAMRGGMRDHSECSTPPGESLQEPCFSAACRAWKALAGGFPDLWTLMYAWHGKARHGTAQSGSLEVHTLLEWKKGGTY